MTTDEKTLAATNEEKEASLEEFDPGELSLIDGHYTYNVLTIQGEQKEIKVPRLTLRQKIKFQRFIVSETVQIQNLLKDGTGDEVQVMGYNFDIMDKMMSILFGAAYDDPNSYLADCNSIDVMTLVGLILRREKLIGNEEETSSEEAGDKEGNPTAT